MIISKLWCRELYSHHYISQNHFCLAYYEMSLHAKFEVDPTICSNFIAVERLSTVIPETQKQPFSQNLQHLAHTNVSADVLPKGPLHSKYDILYINMCRIECQTHFLCVVSWQNYTRKSKKNTRNLHEKQEICLPCRGPGQPSLYLVKFMISSNAYSTIDVWLWACIMLVLHVSYLKK